MYIRGRLPLAGEVKLAPSYKIDVLVVVNTIRQIWNGRVSSYHSRPLPAGVSMEVNRKSFGRDGNAM